MGLFTKKPSAPTLADLTLRSYAGADPLPCRSCSVDCAQVDLRVPGVVPPAMVLYLGDEPVCARCLRGAAGGEGERSIALRLSEALVGAFGVRSEGQGVWCHHRVDVYRAEMARRERERAKAEAAERQRQEAEARAAEEARLAAIEARARDRAEAERVLAEARQEAAAAERERLLRSLGAA